MPAQLPRRPFVMILLIVASTIQLARPSTAQAAPSETSVTKPRNLAEVLPGSLVIAGGGKLPKTVFDRFIRLAGSPAHIVVIPTASARAETKSSEAKPPEYSNVYWKLVFKEIFPQRGVRSLSVLHTRSRDEANDEAFTAPLRKANGVWIAGDLPGRLAEAYVGTRVEAELRALLARGGVVGGTTDSAECMTKMIIEDGRDTPTLAIGFDLLPGAVVAPHFLTRNRQSRLAGVLEANPGLVGFGIDEGTALVIDGRRRGGRIVQVIGKSKVVVMHAAGEDRPASARAVRARKGRFPRLVGDFIAMRRDAIARAARPAFPPKKPVTPHLANGTVIMVGGGGLPRPIIERFIEAAGGKDAPIVIIPTAVGGDAASRPSGFERVLRRMGVENITVRHSTKKAEIETEAFLAPIRKARGIWFGGGRQWRLVDAYEGTTALKLFHDVLARGGVIGGSSAGTSIQAGYMVRGNPLGNTDMMAAGYERGFGFVEGIAVDQHFTQRGRHKDLRKVMRHYPQILGIGVDESTAIVVTKSTMEVIGQHVVSVFDYVNRKPTAAGAANKAKDYVVLKAGDRYDLAKRARITKRSATVGR